MLAWEVQAIEMKEGLFPQKVGAGAMEPHKQDLGNSCAGWDASLKGLGAPGMSPLVSHLLKLELQEALSEQKCFEGFPPSC